MDNESGSIKRFEGVASRESIALTAKAAALYAKAQKIESDAEEYGKMVSRWQVAHELRITADEYMTAAKGV